jgi:hypothetical protein
MPNNRESEVVEFRARRFELEQYAPKWPRSISVEEWFQKAHPDVPALPWISDDGAEIYSLTVVPLKSTGGIMVVLYDARGREAVRSALSVEHAAIQATAMALGAKVNELTFLPPC